MTPLHELLAPWRDAGVLAASDVHIAVALARLTGEQQLEAVLAAALAARAPRLGDSCVDLQSIALTIVEHGSAPGAGSGLDWPDPTRWLALLADSPLVTGPSAPLVVRSNLVALDRYHRYEQRLAARLREAASAAVVPIRADPELLARLLDGTGSEAQHAAVRMALDHGLMVLAGGPGTGKTTTVAALVACLVQSLGSLRIALAAPTGKAAARLGEAFRSAAVRLPDHLASPLLATPTSTIHRLLGPVGESSSRFRHGPGRPLPYDLVIVDEASMVSLPLMAALVAALAPEARLVIVGDPGQLASVDAGSVLADIVGPVVHGAAQGAPDGRARRSGTTAGTPVGSLADCVAVLSLSRRFPPGSAIDRFSRAVGGGDATAARAVLAEPPEVVESTDGVAPDDGPRTAVGLRWLPDPDAAVSTVRALVEPVVLEMAEHAAAGRVEAALASLDRTRVLCGHRQGAMGVVGWNERIESWLASAGHQLTDWYPGRPVMVTANDYRLGLFNGDVGVAVTVDAEVLVAFPAAAGPRLVAPSRLESIETVHAMTIHKSQGSEFDDVVVVLPPAGSRLASRELLYTAVTRARHRVVLVGSAAALDEVVARRAVRVSGLGAMLWGDDPTGPGSDE